LRALNAQATGTKPLQVHTIYAKIKDDGFPDNIMLGGRAVWRKSEVMAWVEEKAAQSRRSRS